MYIVMLQIILCVCVCVCGRLVYIVMLQICVWSEDVNRFVEDDENEFSYSGNVIILVFPWLLTYYIQCDCQRWISYWACAKHRHWAGLVA